MTPELRAIADRFIYEQATIKHIAALIPEGGLDRAVPGSEWSVRQLLAHLGQSLVEYQQIVERWLRGEPPHADWDADASNAETAVRYAQATHAHILELFGAGLNGLVTALAAIPDDRLSELLGPFEAMATLRAFGSHCLSHAIPVLNAVPEARMDPLVLNWLLDAKFQDQASTAWQAHLLEEARVYIANHPQEEGEE